MIYYRLGSDICEKSVAQKIMKQFGFRKTT